MWFVDNLLLFWCTGSACGFQIQHRSLHAAEYRSCHSSQHIIRLSHRNTTNRPLQSASPLSWYIYTNPLHIHNLLESVLLWLTQQAAWNTNSGGKWSQESANRSNLFSNSPVIFKAPVLFPLTVSGSVFFFFTRLPAVFTWAAQVISFSSGLPIPPPTHRPAQPLHHLLN